MSSIIEKTYDIHPTRRITDVSIGAGITAGYFAAIGDDVYDGPNDGRTGTFGIITDNDGARVQINTVAVNGDYNHIYGNQIYRRNFEPNFFSRFRFPASSVAANFRAFLGLTNLDPATMTNSNMGAGTSPAGYYCGLWKDTASSQLKFIRNNNTTTATVQDLGTIDVSVHNVYMWLKRSGGGDIVIFQLDNGTRYEVNTNIPSPTQNLMYQCAIRTLNNATKTIEIGKIHIDCKY